ANQNFDLTQPVRLLLRDPDFVTATKIAEQVNITFSGLQSNPSGLLGLKTFARPVSAGVVELSLPDSIQSQDEAVFFIASVETLRVTPDREARVVINERTGTVVAGGHVKIDEIMIAHGNLTIHTSMRPVISQPQASFSNTGQTVVVPITDTKVQEEESSTGVIPATTTVSELAAALNRLGLKPRDTIAIFQAIKEAGALNAKLIIM
ncbi:MAG: flagellar basal body P-ring protein FlgI, partial [Fidelibacterota bacterium]